MIELYDACEKLIHVNEADDTVAADREYDNLMASLDKHFDRRRNVIYEVHQFRQMKQESDEKLEMYIIRLRTQAAKCGYQGERLKEELLQMIVKGTTSSALQDKLLATAMTLEDAISLGKVLEDRKMQANAFKHDVEMASVHRVQSGLKRKVTEDGCSACGFDDHKRPNDPNCPAKRAVCLECGKIGHYGRCCRTGGQGNRPPPKKQYADRSYEPHKKRPKRSFWVAGTKPDSDEDADQEDWKCCFMINHAGTGQSNKLRFVLGNVPVRLFVDSGAEVSIMSSKTWKQLVEKGVVVTEIDHTSKQRIAGITKGAELKVTHSFTAEVQVEDHTTSEKFYVAENAAEDILSSRAAKELHCLAVGYKVYDVQPVSKNFAAEARIGERIMTMIILLSFR